MEYNMKDVEIITKTKKKLKNPILICGLPDSGFVGKIASYHFAKGIGAEKFADVYSSHLPAQTIVNENGTIEPLKFEFYYKKGKNDLLIFTGDVQSETPEGQSVGVVKNLAHLCHITIKSNSKIIYDIIKPHIISIDDLKPNELFDKIISTADVVERNRLTQEVERYVMQEKIYRDSWFHEVVVIAYRDRIKGLPGPQMNVHDNVDMATVWIDSSIPR